MRSGYSLTSHQRCNGHASIRYSRHHRRGDSVHVFVVGLGAFNEELDELDLQGQGEGRVRDNGGDEGEGEGEMLESLSRYKRLMVFSTLSSILTSFPFLYIIPLYRPNGSPRGLYCSPHQFRLVHEALVLLVELREHAPQPLSALLNQAGQAAQHALGLGPQLSREGGEAGWGGLRMGEAHVRGAGPHLWSPFLLPQCNPVIDNLEASLVP